MNRYVVELSQENLPLARAELDGAVTALDGRVPPSEPSSPAWAVPVELEDAATARALANRLALARRVVEPWVEARPAELAARLAGRAPPGSTAAFRPWRPGPREGTSSSIDWLAQAWIEGGGTIDLTRPSHRFCYDRSPDGTWWFAEEVARIDRRSFTARRMPNLPFQRPVSLAPRLARAAANLAEIRPGDRVVDPFVGTGALLLEAGLLGARLTGVDLDPVMVRGAIRNLRHVGLDAEQLVAGDAEAAVERLDPGPFDAIVTDPPYGRASGSRGEAPARLLARVLPLYAERLRPRGRLVVIVPGGADPIGPPWERRFSLPDRVHRTLTREFRVYARGPPT